MTDEEFEREYRSHKMHKKDFSELITEYPFFRDGMTYGEFDDEQAVYFKFLADGGHLWDYKSLWKRRQEGEDV